MHEQVIIGEAVAGQASTVRKKLLNLVFKMQSNTFDMAELLYEVQENSYYLQWGFESIYEYASSELGIKERKVQYLVRIVKVCRDVHLDRKHYEPAGISKLREITTLDPDGFYFDEKQNHPLDEMILDLILEAPEMSFKEVEERVSILKGQTDENRMVLRNYKVTQSTWDRVIKPAMEMARRKLGSAGRDDAGNAQEYPDGVVWEIICVSYLQDPNNFMEESNESGEQIENTEDDSITNHDPSMGTGQSTLPTV